MNVNDEDAIKPVKNSKGHWLPGQSGNPKGRPPGLRAEALRGIVQSRAHELIEVAMQQALTGDSSTLQFLLSRVLPPLRPVSTPLPISAEHREHPMALASALVSSACNGEDSPDAAIALLGALGNLVKVQEAVEFERRLAALEERLLASNETDQ